MCNVLSCRPKAAAVLPRVFSPCEEAQRHGLDPRGSTTAHCMSALAAALESNSSAWATQYPFNVPPLLSTSALNESLNPDAACPAGHILSPRYGGECISCSNGTVDVSTQLVVANPAG